MAAHAGQDMVVQFFFRFFFAECEITHGKDSLPNAREKALNKELFATHSLSRVAVGKRFAVCLLAFAECF